MAALSELIPAERIAAIADAGSLTLATADLALPRPSPHLARWNIRTQADDGIVCAAGTLRGRRVLLAAQDERYLGGSVGVRHAAALHALCTHALATRPTALVVVCASGGVRLHEANPAELALARALGALLDVRAAGIPVLAIAAGDVFGGASVLACASDRLAMVPPSRLGLSGPKVIATARGNHELDPADSSAIAALFGAEARAAQGHADLVADDSEVIRAWVDSACRNALPFAEEVRARHAMLASGPAQTAAHAWSLPEEWGARLQAVAPGAGLWRMPDRPAWIVASSGLSPVDAARVHAQDDALLEHLLPQAGTPGATLVLVEDSPGHEVSVAAERACLSRHLAHHAEVLALLRHRGVHLKGVLAGQGHSAAFFVNALQAQELVAARTARVMAMDPAAVARVTRLPAAALADAILRDAVLGHAIGCFAHWGGVRAIRDVIDNAELDALTR